LKAYQIVDNANDLPYAEVQEVIWEGLGLIDYAFMPHFDSDHGESANIAKEIQRCKDSHIPFKAVRDGEVIIIE
jgi:dipeptidase E